MRGGSQRGVITIQRTVQLGVDKLNAPIIHWKDWRELIFCEVSVHRGKEQFDTVSKQRFSEEVWHFRTRYDEVVGIDNSMKILHEGQQFDIKAVRPDAQRHEDCIIECTVQDSVLGAAPLAINIGMKIPSGIVGQAFSLTLTASGGTAPYAFALVSGALPTGLMMGASSGAITGPPSAAGTFPFIAKVTDAEGDVAELPEIDLVVEVA